MRNHEARADAGPILRHRPLTYRIIKECPLPVVSSARTTSPIPITLLTPSLAVISAPARD